MSSQETEECPCCHQILPDEEWDPSETGCGGYGYDYTPGSEQCDFCPERESCAKKSRGDN